MTEPITKYVEERHEFGEADCPNPVPGVMQVFYEDGIPVMVDFLCPCGCGSTCPTHLVPPVEKHKGRRWEFYPGPKLVPSVRFTGGCKAHFNIEDGGVVKMHAD
jgi:Family of unknown function (DUF6527)